MTTTSINLTYDDIIDLVQIPDIVTVDTESGETRGLMGISIAFDGLFDGFYLGVNHEKDNLKEPQKDKLFRTFRDKILVFHNAAYDLKVLQRNGYKHNGRFYDTMLMVHWINENLNNYSLDFQSRTWGGKPKNRSDAMQFIIDNWGWDEVPIELMREYSANDAWITHELFRKVLPEFQSQGFDGELWDIEQKFIWIVANMIELGIKIDLEFCVREMIKGQEIMNQLRAELMFNPSSSIGLEHLLIEQLQLPVVRYTATGKPSFDKKAMQEYDMMLESKRDERAKKVLRYRGWQKAVSSNYKAYIDLRDSDNILHPGYKLHGTETGRMSCEKPNLQQIPKASDKEWNGNLKHAFIPRHGYGLWEFDYAQLQFRLTCAYAEEEVLIDIFKDPARDIFDEMAMHLSWERFAAKTLSYLTIFGGGGNRASIVFNVPLERGKEIVEEFHGMYPGIRKISKKAERVAQYRHYVNYWTGRRRHFPKYSKYYQAFNSIIQGGEAEIVKRAMIKLDERVCDENCRMVLQVHDSIVFEIRTGYESEYFPRIKATMEEIDYDFGVPFLVDGKKWGEK